MGDGPILSIIHTVIIGTMLNNNSVNNEYVTCKQTFLRFISRMVLIQVREEGGVGLKIIEFNGVQTNALVSDNCVYMKGIRWPLEMLSHPAYRVDRF